MMDQKVQRKTNPVLTDVIRRCEEASRKNDAPIWADVATALKKANRAQTQVNLSRIERNTEDGDVVVVPGKVLGSGDLETDVTVAALSFTASARDAVNAAGTVAYIEDLIEENPNGTGITIIR